MNKNCFCSWSGGKDSCLALYRAMQEGYTPRKLMTMFSLENNISTAHRLPEKVIQAQAKAIGVDSLISKCCFDAYEAAFVENLKSLKGEGIGYGVFGDIDFPENRKWEEDVCAKAGLIPLLPLWQQDREMLVKSFLDLGFKAKIVVVNTDMIDAAFLGQDLSHPLLEELAAVDADVCGETGEYHTVVYDGPLFRHPVALNFGKEIIPVGKSWAQIEVKV